MRGNHGRNAPKCAHRLADLQFAYNAPCRIGIRTVCIRGLKVPLRRASHNQLIMALATKRKAKGPEHKHFELIEERSLGQDRVRCHYCSKELVAGASRMRGHLLKKKGVSCSPCTADLPEAVRMEMQQVEDEARACKVQKQKDAALDAATHSVSASASATSSTCACSTRPHRLAMRNSSWCGTLSPRRRLSPRV
jgi:hypothetical protein